MFSLLHGMIKDKTRVHRKVKMKDQMEVTLEMTVIYNCVSDTRQACWKSKNLFMKKCFLKKVYRDKATLPQIFVINMSFSNITILKFQLWLSLCHLLCRKSQLISHAIFMPWTPPILSMKSSSDSHKAFLKVSYGTSDTAYLSLRYWQGWWIDTDM